MDMYTPCICDADNEVCVFVCERRKIGVFQLEKEKSEKKERRARAVKRWQTHRGWFSPQGVLLYSCSDIAHKQPPWGIKWKDLDSENGASGLFFC